MKTKNFKTRCEVVKVDVYFDYFKNIDVLTIVKRYGDNTIRRDIVPNHNPSYNDVKMSILKFSVKPTLHYSFHDTEF